MRGAEPVPASKINLSPLPNSSSQHVAAWDSLAVGIPGRRRMDCFVVPPRNDVLNQPINRFRELMILFSHYITGIMGV